MATRHFFAGSNTYLGFRGCFGDIFNTQGLERLFILKGGPGVGKSSLMKRVAAHAEGKGCSLEMYHCSSDPASLDGIIIDGRIAAVDGTAPHIVDPVFPAAVDELISLGDGLDASALIPKRVFIEGQSAKMRALFAAAHSAEQCAMGARETASALTSVDFSKLDDIKQILPPHGTAEKYSPLTRSARSVFIHAVTPDGLISLTDFSKFTRIIRINAPWGVGLSTWLAALDGQLCWEGVSVCRVLDPINAALLEGLIINDDSIVLACEAPLCVGETVIALDARRISEAHCDSARRTFEQSVLTACSLLNMAREVHSNIEGAYTNAMDFSLCDRAYERIIERI